ncbi:MAG: MOSC domain-containing protein [Solirubrobacteraceae bacterium]
MSPITVTGLSVAPVKAMRVAAVDEIELGPLGARGNRAFCVIDERGRMVNGKSVASLQTVRADYDAEAGELGLVFPDGAETRAALEYGEAMPIRFFGHESSARELRGPWGAALSQQLGRSLRLVAPDIGVDRGRRGAASLVSLASLRRLAQEAGEDTVDVRRFRMLIEIDGVQPHAEDGWVGRRVRVGGALLAMHGHVGRCLITSRDPVTGQVTLPTLDLLGGYRREVASTEPLPFGIHGEVLEPGPVRVGDAVALVEG